VKKKRKRVAVDEKELKINGTTIFIWVAVDLDDEKVIAVWVSFGRSGLEAESFLKKIKSVCKGRLPRIFIDSGSWYPWALNVVGSEDTQLFRLDPEALLKDYLAILNVE
jgi:transposase-like protein